MLDAETDLAGENPDTQLEAAEDRAEEGALAQLETRVEAAFVHWDNTDGALEEFTEGQAFKDLNAALKALRPALTLSDQEALNGNLEKIWGTRYADESREAQREKFGRRIRRLHKRFKTWVAHAVQVKEAQIAQASTVAAELRHDPAPDVPRPTARGSPGTRMGSWRARDDTDSDEAPIMPPRPPTRGPRSSQRPVPVMQCGLLEACLMRKLPLGCNGRMCTYRLTIWEIFPTPIWKHLPPASA